MSRLVRLFLAIACTTAVALGSKDASAAIIFNTTGSSGIGSAVYSPTLWASTLFHTTASDYVLDSLSFRTNNTLGTRDGNIIVKVFSEGGNKPGTQVGTNLGAFGASNLSTTISLSGLNRTLSPSTNYWLVLDLNAVTGGGLSLLFSTTPSGIGSPFYYAQSPNSGTSWDTNAGVALIGEISTTSAVPEPSTIAMVLVPVGFLTISRLRRMKTICKASGSNVLSLA